MAKEKKVSPIFEIIQKLEKGEKRSFNIYASSYETKSNSVVALFNIIYDYTHTLPEGTVPEESAIAPQLKKANLTAQYTNIKNRLKTVLFDYIYDRVEDPRVHSGQKGTLGIILMNNGHHEIGMGLLREAKKESIDQENWVALLQCQQAELSLMGMNGYASDEEYRDMLQQIKDTLLDLDQDSEALYLEILARKHNHQKTAMPAELGSTDQILEKIARARSIKTKFRLYNTLSAVSMAQDPPEITVGYIESSLAMLETKEDYTTVERYLSTYVLYLLVLFKVGGVDKYRKQLQKMEAKLLRFRAQISRLMIAFFDATVLLSKVREAILAHDTQGVGITAEKLEVWLMQYDKELSHVTMMQYYGFMRDAYFYSCNYDKAYLSATEGAKNLDLSLPSALSGYIIELISAYELRHSNESINNAVRKIRASLERKATTPTTLQFIEGLINHTRDLVASRSSAETTGHLEAIQNLCDKTLTLEDAAISAAINTSFLKDWLATKSA